MSSGGAWTCFHVEGQGFHREERRDHGQERGEAAREGARAGISEHREGSEGWEGDGRPISVVWGLGVQGRHRFLFCLAEV